MYDRPIVYRYNKYFNIISIYVGFVSYNDTVVSVISIDLATKEKN